MGFRIDVISLGAKTRISLAGQLSSEGVGELKQAAVANSQSLELDLSDLTFADSDGVEALRGLIDKGATVLDASPFIERLLRL